MASKPEPIDIDAFPALREIVEDVNRTRTPRMIRSGDEDVAMVVPLRPRKRRRRQPTEDDHAAFLSSAGGWSDVDIDEFKAIIEEGRRVSIRPPVEL
jgi:hypothetical protein